MNFIDKALERAKALRQKKGKPAATPDTQGMPDISRTHFIGTNEAFGPTTSLDEIEYTFTRTLAIDKNTLRRNRIITEDGDAIAVEQFKMLRTRILHLIKSKGHNTLMITGPLAGEGKTFTAINLAISISQEMNQTVLLVDADLRSPSIHRYFGFPSVPGLVDYLTKRLPIPELLIHPQGLGKLVVLPGGSPVSQAAELINSSLMVDLVQELKHFYPDRYVLFDSPPLLSFADALAFAPRVDGIIVVVEAGRTPREDIVQCLDMLKDFPVSGLVFNKAETRPQLYYNHYYYREGRNRVQKRNFRFPWFK